jgi:ligand-binding sensor domain-containing protein
VLWCGTDDGNVWISQDGGSDWTKVSDELPLRWVTGIAADTYDQDKAFVCFSGFRWDSYQPHVFMTADAGNSWTDISSNLPEAPVNDIIADPSVDSTLYVATDFGVYVSWDYGQHWQVLGSELPNVPVVDIRLHDGERKLIAATYGRSMYTFDLDAIVGSDEIANEPLVLYAYPNPFMNELTIDLETRIVSKISLMLLDGQGKMLKQYSDISKPGHNSFRMNTSELPEGVYFLRFTAGSSSSVKKMIRVR